MLNNAVDRLLVRFARGGQYESDRLRRRFEGRHDIHVGLYSIGGFDRWRIPPGTRIGRYCSIAKTARLVEADHPVESLTTHPFLYLPEFGVVAHGAERSAPQVIEDDVWLGHNATVLPGCKRIGRGAVIGAGSIVMGDVPRYAVMSGVPAKLVRYRFPPAVRAALEATRWWELDKADLARGLKAAPAFGTEPTVENARDFYRAVHGRDLPLDEPAAIGDTPALPRLPREEVAALVRRDYADFDEAQFATPLADLPLDSFALINLRVAFEAAVGAQVHDAAWGSIQRLEDLVGERGASPRAPAPVPAATVAPPVAAEPATEVVPAGQTRHYALNMPQMALKGLSEPWLFKELGDIHWAVLLDSLGTSSAALTDATGARLYATFTRIRLRSDAPLSAYRENDRFSISMSEERYGAAMFFGTARIEAPGARATAELMTTFSKYGEAGVNTSLLKGTPMIPPGFPIPELPALPVFGQEYRARRAEPHAPALFETEYEMLPVHDINGVGLLYFAAYPAIAELCAGRHAGRGFAFDYSTCERDVMYFANADPSETLIVRLHRWEQTDEEIAYEATISRKSDDKTMAVVAARKRRIG